MTTAVATSPGLTPERLASTLKNKIRSILIDGVCVKVHGGIGDDMMLTTVAREFKRRGTRNVFVITKYPDIFAHNSDVRMLAEPGAKREAWIYRLAGANRVHDITYARGRPSSNEPGWAPREHILAFMCRDSGISSGRVSLRPYLHLTREERSQASRYEGWIALQSSGLAARWALTNKEWYPDRFAAVAEKLLETHRVVQVGSPDDPPVPCTEDLRGRTSLRELPAILANCRLFVGLIGMPMHMARAVDCPSVIVYGGRERPDQSGYGCNYNLYTPVECAPCWMDSRCDHERKCMDAITTDHVLRGVSNMLDRPRGPLAVDETSL